MSYSVMQLCGNCAKQPTCADGVIVAKAVETIHGLAGTGAHQGGGAIIHHCSMVVTKPAS